MDLFLPVLQECVCTLFCFRNLTFDITNVTTELSVKDIEKRIYV